MGMGLIGLSRPPNPRQYRDAPCGAALYNRKMIRITVDDELRRKFHHFKEDVEICDEEGRVLARFQPSTPWTDPDQWEPLTPEISQEEIARRLAAGGPRYTTAQVIERLSNL